MHVVQDSVWNLHRTRITPSKECDVKPDTRLCRAYCTYCATARRIVVVMPEHFWEEYLLSSMGKNDAGERRLTDRENPPWRTRWLRRRTLLWILRWKILLKIPIVLKCNFQQIRERYRAVTLRYSLFLQVTRWWRVNVTASTEKLEMSHVTARNNGERSEFYS